MSKTSKSSPKQGFSIGLIGLALFFLVLAAWGWWGVFFSTAPDDSTGFVGARGTFGDSFGALNALFSGLAFIGLTIAILYQRRELAAYHRELALVTDEMKNQGSLLKQQVQVMRVQQLDSTFFKTLEYWRECERRFMPDSGSVIINGMGGFSPLWNAFGELTKSWENDLKELTDIESYHYIIQPSYQSFYKDYREELGNYFRSLSYLLQLIDSSGVPNPKHYGNLVRARLSGAERRLIIINCISFKNGSKSLASLVAKFDLVDNNLEKLFTKPEIGLIRAFFANYKK